jgi:hypothetical protein
MSILANNTFKYMRIDPYGGKTTYPADDIIDFYFPTSGFLHLSSLMMMFNVNFSNSGTPGVCMPRDSESIIHRLEIMVNGKTVNDINQYNHIFRGLSDYALTAEEIFERSRKRNGGSNGTPSVALANTHNVPYYCEKWLGLLNEDVVVDLSKNTIQVRITLAPRFIIVSPNAIDTYSISNVYFLAKYYERYNGEKLKAICDYADFKSILEFNPSLTQSTNLKITTKNLDYVLATFLGSGFRNVASALNGTVLNTQYFIRSAPDSWNIHINGRPLFQFEPTFADTVPIIKSMFPYKVHSVSPNTQVPFSSIQFLCGGLVGFTNETPEEIEIQFVSKGAAFANFALVSAKLTNTISFNI